MKSDLKKLLWSFLIIAGTTSLVAQTTISGTVIDGSTQTALADVNIIVVGTSQGTVSDSNGEYTLTVSQALPVTIRFTYLGFKTENIEVNEKNSIIDLVMIKESLLGQEIVVSASRLKQRILKSPVTVEKMGINFIKQTASADYYDAIANIKGVQVTKSSLNFASVNTRGFADISNPRFVQIMDGMDLSDPTISSNLGSIYGLGELDIESLELLPGAASALYGPNAFNGTIIMNSKNPFDYQGLSIMVQQGFTDSNAGGTHGMETYSFRYAKAFEDKFAFKVNFYYLGAEDWTANDYKTDRNNPNSTTDLSNEPNFDGLNLHGDEYGAYIDGIGEIYRTGIKEATLLDHNDATTLKADVALHYKINDKSELIGSYRFGTGNSIGQSNTKYAYRDFVAQFIKLELKGDNYFVRSYINSTDIDKTFDVGTLGAYVNETFNPSIREDGTGWFPDYITAYLGGVPNVTPNNHSAARTYADRFMIDPITGEYVSSFKDVVDEIRTYDYQANPPGPSFFMDSNFWHTELFYNFNQVKWADIIVGGNLRRYSLFSNNTLFNEAPDLGSDPERFYFKTFGGYTQISKTLANKFDVAASIRFDKMDDFEGRLTPRVSLVYSPDKNNNVRINYQTGFRFPDMIQQFMFFPTPTGIALGGVSSNASRYGVYNGGTWTESSFDEFISQGGTIDPSTGAIFSNPGNVELETLDAPYLKPEELTSFEIGYNSIISKTLLIDLNYYHTTYTNFLGGVNGYSKEATAHRGEQIDAGTRWLLYANSPSKIKSDGLSLGATYNLPNNFVLTGNYTYTTFSGEQPEGFLTMFNTPKNRYNLGFSNNKLTENLGFNVNFSYQDAFIWESDYGTATMPSYSLIDTQVNYKLSAFKTIVKIGATNIGGSDYRTNFGSTFIGQTYYVSLVFDDLLRN